MFVEVKRREDSGQSICIVGRSKKEEMMFLRLSVIFIMCLYNGHPSLPVSDVVEGSSVVSELVLDLVRECRGFSLLSVALKRG